MGMPHAQHKCDVLSQDRQKTKRSYQRVLVASQRSADAPGATCFLGPADFDDGLFGCCDDGCSSSVSW
jgi:hypothetical protein